MHITASSQLSKAVGRQKQRQLPWCSQAWAVGTTAVQQPRRQPRNLCPGQEAHLHPEIRVSSTKAGQEHECQARDLAKRLSNPNQSCWLCSHGLLKSTVSASAETRLTSADAATSQRHWVFLVRTIGTNRTPVVLSDRKSPRQELQCPYTFDGKALPSITPCKGDTT